MARAQRALVVVASAAARCAVCAGARRVGLLVIGQPLDAGPVACPHCHIPRLPVVHLPVRTDLPRKVST